MEFAIATVVFGPVFALCAAGMLAMLPEREIASFAAETPKALKPCWKFVRFLK
jgi:hypothetical protein